MRRQGSADSSICAELITLARLLQRGSGGAWSLPVGRTLEAALCRAPELAERLRGDVDDDGTVRGPPSAETGWLVLGALSVAGGHVESVLPGGRVLCRQEVQRGPHCTVLAVGAKTATLVHDSALHEAQATVMTLELAEVQPEPEVEPSIEHVTLAPMLHAVASLLFAPPPSRAPLAQLGPPTCERCPPLALLQSRACKVVHALLTGAQAPTVAAAVLRVGLLPKLVEVASITLPVFLPPSGAPRSQMLHAEHLALRLDAALHQAAPMRADVRRLLPEAEDVVPAMRLGVRLGSALSRDDALLELYGLGLPPRPGAEHVALDSAEGDVSAAARRLMRVGDGEGGGAGEAERQASALVTSLEAMGFAPELCAYALRRVGNDLQRAADWLLEGGSMPEGTGAEVASPGGGASGSGRSGSGSGGSGSGGGDGLSIPVPGGRTEQEQQAAASSGGRGASSSFGASLAVGSAVDLCDEGEPPVWREGSVADVSEHAVQVALHGWCAEWSEWISRSSSRLRASHGDAADGPLAPRSPSPHPSSGGASGSGAAAAGSGGAATAAAAPAGGARPSGRPGWLWRSSASSTAKRRTAADASSAAASSMSSTADFFSADMGLSRVVDHAALAPSALGDGLDDRPPRLDVGDYARIAVRAAEPHDTHEGHVGIVVAVVEAPHARVGKRGAAAAPARRLDVLLATEQGAMLRSGIAEVALEAPLRQMGAVAAPLGCRALPALARLSCSLHQSLAVLHCRRSVLTLLCEPGWMHAAEADKTSPFELHSLEGLRDDVVRILKLACVADPCEDDVCSEALNMVCVSASNLLTDEALLRAVPSLGSLPDTLADECVRFLARTATGVQQAETNHPSEVGERSWTLACPGVSMMQLHFDARSWLARGASLSIYLDVAGTQEAFHFDSEDLLATEVLCVPVGVVHLRYHCTQNRDHAWGWKVHVLPHRWRVGHEVTVAGGPFEYGWELLQLLVEEAPAAIATPPVLAHLLRYLLYGRAPHKERACLLLLKTLPMIKLDEPPLDAAVFRALEQQIGWHDSLLKQVIATDCR